MQKFYANPRDTFTHPNSAVGYRSGGPFDCLGPYAKVKNCPIADYPGLRYTGYPDTAISVPAGTRIMGKRITGFFTTGVCDGLPEGVFFVPHTERGYQIYLEVAAARRVIPGITRSGA